MIPENRLSSVVIRGPFLRGDDKPFNPMVDYEMGGVELFDGTQGLDKQLWKIESNGKNVYLGKDGEGLEWYMDIDGVTEISLAFDQNMRPTIAYTVNELDSYLHWFDTSQGQMTTTLIPTGSFNLRLCMDDKRFNHTSTSDIILAYVRDSRLYYRQQRDRFQVEYELEDQIDGRLVQVGMNNRNRLQFKVIPGA